MNGTLKFCDITSRKLKSIIASIAFTSPLVEIEGLISSYFWAIRRSLRPGSCSSRKKNMSSKLESTFNYYWNNVRHPVKDIVSHQCNSWIAAPASIDIESKMVCVQCIFKQEFYDWKRTVLNSFFTTGFVSVLVSVTKRIRGYSSGLLGFSISDLPGGRFEFLVGTL